MQPDLVVNTLEKEVDVKSELKKVEGLFEKVGKGAPEEEPMILTPEEPADSAKKLMETKVENVTKEEKKESVSEAVEPAQKEDTVLSTENTENTVTMETTNTLPADVSDEVTVITEGTSLKGDLQSTFSYLFKKSFYFL